MQNFLEDIFGANIRSFFAASLSNVRPDYMNRKVNLFDGSKWVQYGATKVILKEISKSHHNIGGKVAQESIDSLFSTNQWVVGFISIPIILNSAPSGAPSGVAPSSKHLNNLRWSAGCN